MNFFKKTTRTCSNCGMSIPDGNMFCEECGTKYTEEAAAPKTNSQQITLYCPNHHVVDDPTCSFCTECGARLVATPPRAEVIPPVAPTPVVPVREEPVPVVRVREEPVPVVRVREEPVPVVRVREEPVPVVPVREEPVPVVSVPEVTTSVVPPVPEIPADIPATPYVAAPTVSKPAPNPIMRAAAPAEPEGGIPDIPDIMRPLTNKDMKR